MDDYKGKSAKIIKMNLGEIVLEVDNQIIIIEPDYEMEGLDYDEVSPRLSVTVKELQDG